MPLPTSTLCSVHCPVVAGLLSAEALVTKHRVFTIQISKCRMVAELVAHCLSAVTQLLAGAVEEVVGVEYLRYGGDGAQLILIGSESSDGHDVYACQTCPDRFLRRQSLKNNRNLTILSFLFRRIDFLYISRDTQDVYYRLYPKVVEGKIFNLVCLFTAGRVSVPSWDRVLALLLPKPFKGRTKPGMTAPLPGRTRPGIPPLLHIASWYKGSRVPPSQFTMLGVDKPSMWDGIRVVGHRLKGYFLAHVYGNSALQV